MTVFIFTVMRYLYSLKFQPFFVCYFERRIKKHQDCIIVKEWNKFLHETNSTFGFYSIFLLRQIYWYIAIHLATLMEIEIGYEAFFFSSIQFFNCFLLYCLCKTFFVFCSLHKLCKFYTYFFCHPANNFDTLEVKKYICFLN